MASQTQTNRPWEPLQDNIISGVDQYANLVDAGVSYFPDSTVAQQSENTQQGVSALAGAAGTQQNTLDAANPGFNFLLNDVRNPDSNPFLQQSAQAAINPVMDQLMQTILPGLGQAAVGAGGFGGTAHANLKGNVIQDAIREMLNTTSGMYSNAYNTGINANLNAMNMMPQMLQSQTNPAQTQLAAGGIEDQQSQAVLNDEVNRYNFNQTAQMDVMDRYLRTIFGSGTGESQVTEQTDPSALDRVINVASLGLL